MKQIIITITETETKVVTMLDGMPIQASEDWTAIAEAVAAINKFVQRKARAEKRKGKQT